ncbi:23S rRNA (adenine(1618)-N(6))-methyltransferase RlmF [Neolewinella persica]|uniref:23S rRNA (adenine(1618)-N(6))-methyltransferase RlmF n=1 Tax=Neolewinella persica TaxID=70998 RepID=UPI00036F2D95|nr:23S rRNA (adenine(1618)-N(6))-methyltransferase RlmF [Neolewinella persica]
MHPRNRYAKPHNFPALTKVVPGLADYLVTTPDGRTSLNFAAPMAVRLLNQALLLQDYDLKFWDIPEGNLCPGVPGRLDYIHALAELLEGDQARTQVHGKETKEQSGKGQTKITGLDIGTGASLIYPILGIKEYAWNFVATDVSTRSMKVAGAIARFNPALVKKVALRRQPDTARIFHNVIRQGEWFDFTMCNPPFFESAEAAGAAARLKWEKLGKTTGPSPTLNFGGQSNELWTAGGEPAFLRQMIRESVDYANQVGWFTTLVSKKGYLRIAEIEFGRLGITTTKTIRIGQGGKLRRILCWRKSD